MNISKISYVNSSKVSQNNAMNRSKTGSSVVGMSKPSKIDSVSFGGLDPITATILQEAAEAAARGILGIKKLRATIKKAEGLFDKFDVKPAIETAIRLDAKHGRNIAVSTDNLLSMAISQVGKLSDEHLVNRDLKQRVLDYCYLDKKDFYNNVKPVENLFVNLNNRYYKDFKKYLISKLASSEYGLLEFENIDSVIKGVGDGKYRNDIKLALAKQKVKMEQYNANAAIKGDVIIDFSMNAG